MKKREKKVKSKVVYNEKGFLQNTWDHRALLMMAMPVIILLILFNYVPMFGSIVAFKKFNYQDGIWGSPWVGLDNFKFLFNMPSLTWRLIRNTVGYYLLFTLIGTVCNVALAVALNECRNKMFAKISQTLMIMPMFISYIAVSYIVSCFLDPQKGMINSWLVSAGQEGILWYYEAKYWPVILAVVKVWKGTGYGAIIYLSALAGMDQELFEAAQIDGASKWQQIRYITLPLLIPTVSIVTLMGVASIMTSDTGLFYQVTKNSSMIYETTQTIDTYVLTTITSGATNFGPSSAVSFFQSIVGGVACVVSNAAVKRVDPDSALF